MVHWTRINMNNAVNIDLMAWNHSFCLFDVVYYFHSFHHIHIYSTIAHSSVDIHRRSSTSPHRWSAQVGKTSLGSRAENRTRAWLTASRRTTNWTTPHPNWATAHPMSHAAPSAWATPHPNVINVLKYLTVIGILSFLSSFQATPPPPPPTNNHSLNFNISTELWWCKFWIKRLHLVAVCMLPSHAFHWALTYCLPPVTITHSPHIAFGLLHRRVHILPHTICLNVKKRKRNDVDKKDFVSWPCRIGC